jgi:hypothetical protein
MLRVSFLNRPGDLVEALPALSTSVLGMEISGGRERSGVACWSDTYERELEGDRLGWDEGGWMDRPWFCLL